MKLIAFAGKALSGKDTAANHLVAKYHYGSHKFAAPIKAALTAMFGLNSDHLEGPLKEEVIPWLGKSPRQLMQSLGTEWGRDLVAEDVWIRIAEQQYTFFSQFDSFGGMVISDCRIDNEADWVRSHGGIVVHISRDNAPAVAVHSSESGLRYYPEHDVIIKNNGTIRDLLMQVDFLVNGRAAAYAHV